MSVASEKPCGRELCHPVGVEAQRGDHPGERGQQHLQRVHGVEDRLLVLLQVPVVGQRQRLERGQQPGEVADQPAGLAPRQLGDVRVLLLRHDRGAGGVGVVQRGEAELLGRPEDHLLGDPGEVHPDHRGDEAELGDEVARRRCRRSSSRTRRRSRARRPRPAGRARARSRPARRRHTARGPCGGPSRAAGRRRGPAPSACASRWCASSTGCACCRWVRPGIATPVCRRPDRPGRRERPGARRRATRACSRRYIRNRVAIWSLRERPARSRPPSFGADPLDQAALERGVHVLVGGGRAERAGGDVGVQRVEPGEHAVELASPSSPAPVQRAGVRAGARDVVRGPAASRSASTGQCGQRLGRAAGEAGPTA